MEPWAGAAVVASGWAAGGAVPVCGVSPPPPQAMSKAVKRKRIGATIDYLPKWVIGVCLCCIGLDFSIRNFKFFYVGPAEFLHLRDQRPRQGVYDNRFAHTPLPTDSFLVSKVYGPVIRGCRQEGQRVRAVGSDQAWIIAVGPPVTNRTHPRSERWIKWFPWQDSNLRPGG